MGQTSIPCTESLRDRLGADKPDGVSWSQYLDALHKDAEFIVVNDDVNIEVMVTELLDTIGATAGGAAVDDSELAHDVAAQIDYAELANRVADELEGRMR